MSDDSRNASLVSLKTKDATKDVREKHPLSQLAPDY
jgi:hypothetical protein